MVTYGGRLQPQSLDREAIAVQQDIQSEPLVLPPEPQYIYSNRSYWYPQATSTDYATARIMIHVPAEYDAVASGTPSRAAHEPQDAAGRTRGSNIVFERRVPLRYLACVISRFGGRQTAQLELPLAQHDGRDAIGHGPFVPGTEGAAQAPRDVQLSVEANPRQTNRIKAFADKTADILRFYTSLIGDVPYRQLHGCADRSRPAGRAQPGVLRHRSISRCRRRRIRWRNDPVEFRSYPTFFLAHESRISGGARRSAGRTITSSG